MQLSLRSAEIEVISYTEKVDEMLPLKVRKKRHSEKFWPIISYSETLDKYGPISMMYQRRQREEKSREDHL